jgi:hypothetical protein
MSLWKYGTDHAVRTFHRLVNAPNQANIGTHRSQDAARDTDDFCTVQVKVQAQRSYSPHGVRK